VRKYNNEVDNNPFVYARNIRLPKEKQLQSFILHDRFYNNKRLAKIKLVDSMSCLMCHETEDNDHLFFKCTRATEAWDTVSKEIGCTIDIDLIKNGTSDKWLNNIISLTKLILSQNRDKPINQSMLLLKIKK